MDVDLNKVNRMCFMSLGTLSGKLIQSQSAFNQELWIKRYAEPAALKDFM